MPIIGIAYYISKGFLNKNPCNKNSSMFSARSKILSLKINLDVSFCQTTRAVKLVRPICSVSTKFRAKPSI